MRNPRQQAAWIAPRPNQQTTSAARDRLSCPSRTRACRTIERTIPAVGVESRLWLAFGRRGRRRRRHERPFVVIALVPSAIPSQDNNHQSPPALHARLCPWLLFLAIADDLTSREALDIDLRDIGFKFKCILWPSEVNKDVLRAQVPSPRHLRCDALLTRHGTAGRCGATLHLA